MNKDIDRQAFPNIGNNPFYKEFHVGNMLPIMGSTKGYETKLANTDIEDVVDKDNEEFNEYIEKMTRSELPDEVFGIPQERKYPMPDKKHVISAIKFFNRVEKKYEKQLAKNIISNMEKYHVDFSIIGKNNRLKKYLPKSIKERIEVMEYTDGLVDDLFNDFFMEGNNPDIPDEIESVVKKLESKGYKVKYASPGHSNTKFSNDRNKDGIIYAKLVTTGRIIFEKDYKFKNTPQGWEWKILNNGAKALYVKKYTYNEKMGTEKEAFEKWKDFYLSTIRDWVDALPQRGSNEETAPDTNFN